MNTTTLRSTYFNHYLEKRDVQEIFLGDWLRWLDEEDIFFPSETWPGRYRQLFINSAKTYSERFQLFLFFAGNGVEPDLAAELVLITGDKYDPAATAHVLSLARKFRDPKWVAKYNWPDGYDLERQWRLTTARAADYDDRSASYRPRPETPAELKAAEAGSLVYASEKGWNPSTFEGFTETGSVGDSVPPGDLERSEQV